MDNYDHVKQRLRCDVISVKEPVTVVVDTPVWRRIKLEVDRELTERISDEVEDEVYRQLDAVCETICNQIGESGRSEEPDGQ